MAAATSAMPLALDWQVADGCPSRTEAERAITTSLRQRGFSRAPAARLSVTITRGASGRFEARVAIVDVRGSGERVFDGASCERVAEAAELIASIALEASDVAERSVRDEPIEVPQPVAAAAAHVEGPRLALGLGAQAGFGSLPKPSAGLGASFGVDWEKLVAELQVVAWLPSFAELAGSERSGGEIGLYAIGIRGCYPLLTAAGAALDVAPCLGLEAGLTTGHGVNVGQSLQPIGHWIATFAGISLRQVVNSGLRAVFSIDAGVPLLRPRYVFDDAGQNIPVFRARQITTRASLGIAWLFR